MATGRIGARSVKEVPIGSSDTFLWDTDLRGFGLKVTPAGKRVFIVQYRTRGSSRTKRATIGELGPLTPDQARQQAKRLLGEVAAGWEVRGRAKRYTVSELCRDYIEAVEKGEVRTRAGLPKKLSTIIPDRGRIQRHIVPLLGKLKVEEVTPLDVRRFVAAVARGETKVDVKTGPRGRAIVTGERAPLPAQLDCWAESSPTPWNAGRELTTPARA